MKVTITHLFYVLLVMSLITEVTFAQLSSYEIKTMTKDADLVIAGKVIQQISSWNENKTKIYTQANIQVDDYIKGNGQGSIVVSYLGGEVGDIGEVYSHMPRFEGQEEVLVFLKRDLKNNDYKVLNGEDGKINVITDPKTGEKVTSSNLPINSLKAQIKSYVSD